MAFIAILAAVAFFFLASPSERLAFLFDGKALEIQGARADDLRTLAALWTGDLRSAPATLRLFGYRTTSLDPATCDLRLNVIGKKHKESAHPDGCAVCSSVWV